MATDLSRVAKAMVRAAKARAAKAGVPFNITPEDISIPHSCPVLDIPLIVGSGKPTDNSPSLDRVVPALGYVRGNVLVISNRANRIKNNATVAELRQVADFFEDHMSNQWMTK
ncbi:hypothetical protein [Shimia sp.]|uniref:hypothetical protein n=1 Tax=Shimia sp. TaxID=1954381 RepID=UPI003BA9B25B